jgi:putative membrane protein
MSTRYLLPLAAVALAFAAGSPLHAQSSAANVSSADQSFLQKASADGATEVALGQQAQQRAQSGPAKEMAQQLVTDHTKANQELADLAMRKHVDVSTQPDAAALAKEKSWSSGAYDHAYADTMVKDHHKAIALFTQASKSNDADIRQFAQTTLPVLKQHLSMAESLEKNP